MEVLQRFAAGDLDAFESLFRQHQRDVYRWIVRIVRDPVAAEDLTVETFWRMHRGHAGFHPDGNFGAWLRRSRLYNAIAASQVYNVYRWFSP